MANRPNLAVPGHAIKINGHMTAISLEIPFMAELKDIAKRRRMTLQDLVSEIAAMNDGARNLSSVIRVYVLRDVMARAQEANETADRICGEIKAIVDREIGGLAMKRRERETLMALAIAKSQGRINA